jgi:hypothetical protein
MALQRNSSSAFPSTRGRDPPVPRWPKSSPLRPTSFPSGPLPHPPSHYLPRNPCYLMLPSSQLCPHLHSLHATACTHHPRPVSSRGASCGHLTSAPTPPPSPSAAVPFSSQICRRLPPSHRRSHAAPLPSARPSPFGDE